MNAKDTTLLLAITGRVQGVFYRASLQSMARSLGLVGWVCNRTNGQVQALVQGPQASVDTLVQWCQRGPPAARVESVTALAQAHDPNLSGFRCLPTV